MQVGAANTSEPGEGTTCGGHSSSTPEVAAHWIAQLNAGRGAPPDVMWDLNVLFSDEASQAQMLGNASAQGLAAWYLELGNELYSAAAQSAGTFPTPTDYGLAMNAWATELKGAFPGSPIAAVANFKAVSTAYEQSWNANVSSVLNAPISAYTIHTYNSPPMLLARPLTAVDIQNLLGHAQTAWSHEVAVVQQALSFTPFPYRFWITEFNYYETNFTNPFVAGSWVQGLIFAALSLIQLAHPLASPLGSLSVTLLLVPFMDGPGGGGRVQVDVLMAHSLNLAPNGFNAVERVQTGVYALTPFGLVWQQFLALLWDADNATTLSFSPQLNVSSAYAAPSFLGCVFQAPNRTSALIVNLNVNVSFSLCPAMFFLAALHNVTGCTFVLYNASNPGAVLQTAANITATSGSVALADTVTLPPLSMLVIQSVVNFPPPPPTTTSPPPTGGYACGRSVCLP